VTSPLTLLEQLNQATRFQSFHDRDHPLFKRLVGLGIEAAPPLLIKLKVDPCWYSMLALWEILEVPPETFPMEHHGKFRALVQDTLGWLGR